MRKNDIVDYGPLSVRDINGNRRSKAGLLVPLRLYSLVHCKLSVLDGHELASAATIVGK
jgi:hypothetical protein